MSKILQRVLKGIAKVWKEEESGPPPPPPSGDPLCQRLEKESKTRPDIRKLYAEVLQGDCARLSEALVGLMFKLPAPPSGMYLQSRAVAALSARSSLKIHRNVFYIYVDKQTDVPDASDISGFFYEHLLALAEEATPLKNLLEARFRLLRQKPDEHFNLADEGHRTQVRNLFSCFFSVCRREFPWNMRSHVYVVGRTPLHDRESIRQFENEQGERIKQSKEFRGDHETNNYDPRVYLAAVLKADGSYNEKRVRLNAHRFAGLDSTSPLPESQIYVGPWLSNWEFSVGSAEHDEIYCAGLGAENTTLVIRNVQSKGTYWHIECDPPPAPSGFKFFLKGEDNPAWEGVRVFLKKYGGMSYPLLDKIGVQAFPQEIRLLGRVLPYSRGQLDKFQEIYDRIRRTAGDITSPESAVKVREGFWLVRSADGSVRRVFGRSDNSWDQRKIEEGVWFGDTDGFQYFWASRVDDKYPEDYCGILTIRPPDEQVKNFGQRLNVDEEAEGLLIAYEETFKDEINPDHTLGKGGVLRVKCVEVKENGTGVYALVPHEGARDPFFAFQPQTANEKWPAPEKKWLVYNPRGAGDLTLDDEGRAAYNGRVLLADQHSYHLVCGTSFFQIKVSGTPRVSRGAAVYAPARLALTGAPSSAASDEPTTAPPSAPEVDLTPQVVRIRLLGTKWEGAEVEHLDQSNFALHCVLKKGDEQRFIKVYYAASAGSALREAQFYERFAERAAKLYIAPPELLRNTPDGIPWAMVFTKLEPLDYWPPWKTGAVTLAQAAAIGSGFAALLQAIAAENLINFDIDPSTLCFTSRGRMVVVDFDNIYPILHEGSSAEEIEMLRDILVTGELPAKNQWLPPEAHDFFNAEGDYARSKALRELGPAYGTYMLAVILLQLLAAEVKLGARHVVNMKDGDIARRAGAEGISAEAAEKFERLLREMLWPHGAERPSPEAVASRFADVTSALAAGSERAKREIEALLGDDAPQQA